MLLIIFYPTVRTGRPCSYKEQSQKTQKNCACCSIVVVVSLFFCTTKEKKECYNLHSYRLNIFIRDESNTRQKEINGHTMTMILIPRQRNDKELRRIIFPYLAGYIRSKCALNANIIQRDSFKIFMSTPL